MSNKRLFRNFIYNLLYSSINIILPLVTLPYVSRILLPEGVGRVSYAQNIVSYFILIASLGIPNYGIREIASSDNDMSERSKVFFEIFFINAISTLLAYILFVSINRFFNIDKKLLLIVSLPLALNMFNVDWFYRGIEEYKYITTRAYLIKLVYIVSVFVFVKTTNDLYIYALLISLSSSINYLYNIIRIRKYISFPKEKLNLLRHIKPVFFMFFSAVAIEIYAQLDTTMLGAISGERSVGLYSNPIKITRIATSAITALSSVSLPSLSNLYKKNKICAMEELSCQILSYLLLFSIPCFFGILHTSKEIVLVLFGNSFLESVNTLRILSLIIPVLAIGNLFGTQLLIAENKEDKLTLSVFCGAITNLVLNSILIKKYQQNGAAFSSFIAEIVVMLIQKHYSTREIKVRVDKQELTKILMQSMFMIMAIAIVNLLNVPVLFILIIKICFGIIVYFISGLILKNKSEIGFIEFVFKNKKS